VAEDQNESADPKVSRWKKRITEALKVEEKWRKSACKIVARYREEDNPDSADLDEVLEGSRFNILYANLAVLKPAIFQNAPRPDVRRRYDPESPNDPQKAEMLRTASRHAVNALERTLTYAIDDGDMEVEILDSVNDMLLPGRGVLRVRYNPVTVDEEIKGPDGKPLLDEATGKAMTTSRIVSQDVWTEHVYWEDFVTAPYRRWSKKDQPPFIAFRHLMDKPQLKKAFGAKAKDVSLTWSGKEASEDQKKRLGEADRAEVWEIWDRDSRKVCWIAMGYSKILDESDDPLGLEGFYPCPRPLYSIKTTDTLVPVPEYKVYVDLANELDEVQERITILTKQLKASGVYNSSVEGLEAVLTAKDGEMQPIKSFELLNGGKLADHVMFWPIETIIAVLRELYVQREQIKQTIYEVVGISDILRGSSDPNETLGAQRIKTQFGTLRIDERRREVNRILRDTLRIMAEIIAEKFEPDVIARMTGVELDGPSLEILRDEGLRGFMVDVETDSTVAPDETAEQEAVTQLLTALVQFIEGMTPVVQAGMMTGKQVVSILRFAIRPFRGARNLEEVLDEAERNMEQAEQMEGGEGPPSKEEIEAQDAQAKAQADAAIRQLDEQIKQIQLADAQAKAESDERIRQFSEERARLAVEAQKKKEREKPKETVQ